MPPRRVALLADADYIQRIYSDTKSYKPCTTCSFTINEHHNKKLKATERLKLQSITNRRISKFYHLFDPMLDFLLINRYAMLNKQQKVDVETMPTDHILVVHLADLPSNALRPQIRIDKLEPRSVSSLNEAERAMLQNDLSSKSSKPEEYRIAHLVSYQLPGGHLWTTVRTNSYDFNPLIVGRVCHRALMERLIAFSLGINEIARGDRPDIYEMIKMQLLKEGRGRDDGVGRGVLMGTLVQEIEGSNNSSTSSSSSSEEEDREESMYFLNKARRRRWGEDGNELTAEACWRE